MNKIRIESKTSESGYTSTKVYFDDHEITGIVKMKLEQDITMHAPVLSLDIKATNLTLDDQMVRVNLDGLGEIEKIIFKEDNWCREFP